MSGWRQLPTCLSGSVPLFLIPMADIPQDRQLCHSLKSSPTSTCLIMEIRIILLTTPPHVCQEKTNALILTPQTPLLFPRTTGHKTCHQESQGPLSEAHSLLFPQVSNKLLVLPPPNSGRAGE